MKKILTLVFVLSSLMAFAQPPNDSCNTATVIPLTNGVGFFSGDITGATASGAGIATIQQACLAPLAPIEDMWYTFTTDATNLDLRIVLEGINAASNPAMALLRGNCGAQVLLPVGCVNLSPTNAQTAELIVTGLDPLTQYYLRVTDYAAPGLPIIFGPSTQMGSPQGGGFINPYCPPVVLDNSTSGTVDTRCGCGLTDSGGPTNNYGPLENYTYTICPSDPHTCIDFTIDDWQFEPFPSSDKLEFYYGNAVNADSLAETVCDQGAGSNISIASSGCVTVRFQSDGTNQFAGFNLTWSCSNNCGNTSIPQSDCYNATDIPTLPYFKTGQTTCGANSNYDATDACNSTYMEGQDYTYTYTSNGDECIRVKLNGTATATGVFVMDGCPLADATDCLAFNEAAAGNPEINSVYLEDSGTYYIVVSSELGCGDCTSFEILVENAPCPLDVDDNVTADSLVNTIAAQGVSVQNAMLTCPQGAFGVFSGGVGDGTQFMDGGIVLSSGAAIGAEGPSSIFSSVQIGSGGDSLLTVLAGQPTQDKCILEFDVFAPTDKLIFDYMFGSEEYNEFVNSSFNDIFAFLVSGPGIGNGTTDEINLAVLPSPPAPAGTSITINTVNNGNPYGTLPNSFPQFYLNNVPADGPALNEDVLGYDGHTIILEAEATVIPCNWYHVRLAIADGSDQSYDSGVLIEANSLFSNAATISSNGSNSQFDNTINAAENCADGSITIDLLIPQIDTATIYLQYGGTASSNDYATLPDSIVFQPGQDTISIPVIPIADGIAEGPEILIVYLISGCATAEPYDSAILIIRDELVVSLPADTIICGEPITMPITHNGADFTFWTPGAGLSDSTAIAPLVSPDTTTTYTVVASNGVCFDTVSITVTPNLFSVAGDTTYCAGGTSSISSTTNLTQNLSYSWSPAAGLSCTDCPSPNVANAPVGVNNYEVTFTSPGCTVVDTVTVEVLAFPNADAGADATLCEGESVTLGGTPESGVSYLWVDQTTGDTISNVMNLDLTPTTSSTYELIADNGQCQSSGSVTVNVAGNFTLATNNDDEIDIGNSVNVTTTATQTGINPIGQLSYVWTPPTGLSDPSSPDPVASPTETTTYTVTATSAAGCMQSASFTIIVNTPYFNVPNAFTPNGDGRNDALKVLSADGANFDVITFKVFNRWGELVFNSTDKNGWDGTVNGEELPQDTYIYQAVIRLPDGTQQEFRGEALLIR